MGSYASDERRLEARERYKQRIRKPESLADANIRLVEMVKYSEHYTAWVHDLEVKKKNFEGWLQGKNISARNLIKIDELTDRHFLTPPERRWAERAVVMADRARRYR